MANSIPEETASNIRDASSAGRKLDAVRIHCNATGTSLSEAKLSADQLEAGSSSGTSSSVSNRSTAMGRARTMMSRRTKIVLKVVAAILLLVGLGFLIEILVFAFAMNNLNLKP